MSCAWPVSYLGGGLKEGVGSVSELKLSEQDLNRVFCIYSSGKLTSSSMFQNYWNESPIANVLLEDRVLNFDAALGGGDDFLESDLVETRAVNELNDLVCVVVPTA